MKLGTVGKYKMGDKWIVWERLSDGTVYEHAPVDYWRALDRVREIRQMHKA